MKDVIAIGLFACFGGLLGGIFFGGLWWTVLRGVSARRPALWFLGSLLVRMGLVLAGFILSAREHWDRFAACLVGFVIARMVVTRLTRPSADPSGLSAQEARHAP